VLIMNDTRLPQSVYQYVPTSRERISNKKKDGQTVKPDQAWNCLQSAVVMAIILSFITSI
jgi:hypothetical protein